MTGLWTENGCFLIQLLFVRIYGSKDSFVMTTIMQNNATFALYINTAFVVNIIPDIKHDELMSCNGNASHFLFMNTRQSVLHLRMKIYLGRLPVAENINAPMLCIGRRKG